MSERLRAGAEAYAAVGVDAEQALARLDRVPISMHCWQGDDVRGFENPQGALTGGISATGNYPGRARNADELRADAEVAMAQIPGPKRFNLHAIYLEAGAAGGARRDPAGALPALGRLGPGARHRPRLQPHLLLPPEERRRGTLSHPDPAIRRFWIDHCQASRLVSATSARRWARRR